MVRRQSGPRSRRYTEVQPFGRMVRVLVWMGWAVFACSPSTSGGPQAQSPDMVAEGSASEPAVSAGAPDAFVVPIADSPVLGSPEAWVTVVEFADFECPFCQRIHAGIQQLMERHPGKVRWVMKHLPLDFHRLATPAAISMLEIREQRGEAAYWEALNELFQEPRLSQEHLQAVTERYLSDHERHARALALGAEHPQLVRDRDLAEDLLVEGTPHFFVNGRRIVGARPVEEFEALFAEEFTRVEQLRARGGNIREPYAALQAQAASAPGLVRSEIVPHDPTVPSAGPPDAPVVVQMFTDFECGYCRRVMLTLEELERRYPGQLRIVFRHLPLPFHENARLAAAAALEVRAQRGEAAFWQMVDRLFGFGPEGPQRLTPQVLEQHALALGVDGPKFQQALAEGVHEPAIERDLQLAMRLGLNGTPAFSINGYQLIGAQPLSRFERLVRVSLEQADGTRSEAPREPVLVDAAKGTRQL